MHVQREHGQHNRVKGVEVTSPPMITVARYADVVTRAGAPSSWRPAEPSTRAWIVAILRSVGVLRQKGVALVLLSALAGLPVSGTVCVALCTPSASSGSAHEAHGGGHDHHSSGSTRDHGASSPGQLQIGGLPGHNCLDDHGTVVDATEALAASRVHRSFLTVSPNLSPSTRAFFAFTSTCEPLGDRPSPGSISPSHAPLVLRI